MCGAHANTSNSGLFHTGLSSYEFYIYDINPELILAYSTIKNDVTGLINALCNLEQHYLSLPEEERKAMFYEVRTKFNNSINGINFHIYSDLWIERTAEIIFLNHTCFNGLFRVNLKGEFNVPFGKYKNPTICDSENLQSVSQLLQKTSIQIGDFESCQSVINNNTFVYFDPPYRPISQTASFNSYSRQAFGDVEQLRLASFYRKMDKLGTKLLLSNSDPKNENQADHFFEDAYQGMRIERVKANRMINSDANARGSMGQPGFFFQTELIGGQHPPVGRSDQILFFGKGQIRTCFSTPSNPINGA